MSRAHWRPVLEGEARRQAVAAIVDIATALEGLPPPRRRLTAAQAGAQFGLFSGRAGIAVFFGYLAEAGLFGGADEIARRFLADAETALAEHPLDWSLASGVVGIAWAHAHLRQGLFGERDRGAFAGVDEGVVRWLRDGPDRGEFDLLYGLVGVGVYALERLPRRSARTMVELVVARLVAGSTDIDGLPGWADPAGRHAWLPAGEFNLGMAHGTPGVVAFLARATALGVAPRSLLRAATDWLLARRRSARGGSSYSKYCSLTGVPGPSARVAWCYGDPGVSAALWSAGRGLRSAAVRAGAVRTARGASRRTAARDGIRDASLCHGSAGLAHLYHRLADASGNPSFRAASTRLLAKTLRFRRPGHGVGGYLAIPGPSASIRGGIAEPGLLTGAAGVGLALLAGVSRVEPAWDRVLLLDTW